jgi:hypothetical protein
MSIEEEKNALLTNGAVSCELVLGRQQQKLNDICDIAKTNWPNSQYSSEEFARDCRVDYHYRLGKRRVLQYRTVYCPGGFPKTTEGLVESNRDICHLAEIL